MIRAGGDGDDGVIGRLEPTDARPGVAYRRDGDDNVLVEYGDMTLDIALRMRVHALMTRLQEHMPPGVLELTPGIRSLQVRTDARVLKATAVTRLLQELEDEIPPTGQLVVPSRKVRLPLSWDDPATRLAIERYMAGVVTTRPGRRGTSSSSAGSTASTRSTTSSARSSTRATSCSASATCTSALPWPRRWIRATAW